MAGSAVIGALRVVLGADTAALEKGLKQSQLGLAAFAGAVGGVMALAAQKVVGAVGEIAGSLHKTIEDFDTLSKTSQKIGIPVEQLSALAYAADLSDVSFEALSKGVGKLAKTMVEAAAKPTSEAANAFRALGVSVTDSSGRLKSSDTVMGDIAAKFEGLKDGAGKTAVAMAIFGKAGADMIPLLNGGRDGLQDMSKEAAQFGAIVSTDAAKQAENFNDNLTRLGYAVKGVMVQTASQLLPTLVDMSSRMVDAAKNSGVLEIALTVVSTALKGVVSGGVLVGATLSVTADTLSIIWGSLAKLMKGDLAGAIDNVKTKAGDIAGTATATMATLDKLWNGSTVGAEGAAVATDGASKTLKDFNYSALAGKNALDQYIASQQKSIAAQQAEFAATGMAASAKTRLTTVLQGLAIAKEKDTVLNDTMRMKLTETANAAELMVLKLGNVALLGGDSNPFIPLGLAIDATNAKLASGALSAQDYATLSEQAAQLTSKLWADSATSIGGSVESIGSSLSQMGDDWARFAKVGQVAGAAVAFVNAYVAASEAFAKTPFPANIAVAAGVLAKGIAMVTAIKGVALPKMAMGGAFRVPGGLGGGDKVPFAAMLEPGELVEVSSNHPGGYQSGAAGAGGVVNITLRGRSFHYEDVREMLDTAQDLIRDGYVLKLKPNEVG